MFGKRKESKVEVQKTEEQIKLEREEFYREKFKDTVYGSGWGTKYEVLEDYLGRPSIYEHYKTCLSFQEVVQYEDLCPYDKAIYDKKDKEELKSGIKSALVVLTATAIVLTGLLAGGDKFTTKVDDVKIQPVCVVVEDKNGDMVLHETQKKDPVDVVEDTDYHSSTRVNAGITTGGQIVTVPSTYSYTTSESLNIYEIDTDCGEIIVPIDREVFVTDRGDIPPADKYDRLCECVKNKDLLEKLAKQQEELYNEQEQTDTEQDIAIEMNQ